MNLYNENKSHSSLLSLITVTIIAIVVSAGVIGNIYTYQLFSSSVRNLENKVTTLQNQITALTEALSNYSQTTIGNISLPELYESIKDSVVLIRGQTSQREIAGSGFIYNYSSDAFSGPIIITNYHVVQDTTSRSVTFRNGLAYSAQILGSDVYADLAVLSIDDAPADELRFLPMVSSSLLKVGDIVIAVGNPYELIGSMTTGIVSQLGRAIPESLAGGYSIANVIQISAPINPGNSGGPLLNSKGQVVGITFAIVENSTGVGFAIPSNTILREIAWLVRGETFPHSLIGVSGTDMTFEIAQEMGASTTYGWLIVEVMPGGPAAEVGLRVDDIILAIDDLQMISGSYISNYLEEFTSPNQTIDITVERNNSKLIISLVLGIRPQP
ncbi:MAG: trypsin-like peptidase domain-containing protein [Candidatus Bathyarchaeota archaeon]|nr:MAG: trypsin-like peptidase domain-containing protein [Candidatus Bathyarchaeota archaeon]